MDIVIIGIDLGKNSCSLAGMDASGRVVLKRQMRRSSLEHFTKGLGRCIIAMEGCCGAHHLGRLFAAQGHEVRLMSPEYVWAYVKAQKYDHLDAEAIAEAATRPTMRFVEVKSQAQSDIQALHRAHER
jgi:transposase